MNTKVQKKIIVGLKELRENMETYIKCVQKGESVTIMRRSTPIFKLSPIDEDIVEWESVADFTKIDKNGISGKEILAHIKNIHGQN